MSRNDFALSGNTLNLLVLEALAAGAEHGYGVARWVEEVTDDALSLEEGTLYPALHRLERRGFLESRWGRSENNRRAKFYRITAAGRTRLATERGRWTRLSDAVGKVVAATAGGSGTSGSTSDPTRGEKR